MVSRLITDTHEDLVEQSTAVFSEDRTYRYVLTRRWAPGPLCVFVMLNPSMADAFRNDPTVKRCLDFARRERAGALTVLNIFALRSTDPGALYGHPDPIGPDNDRFLDLCTRDADLVVAAWGVHGAHLGRGATVASQLAERGVWLACLGTTSAGFPRHPLYVRGDTPLMPYGERKAA